MNRFGKVAGYKVNLQKKKKKTISFLHTTNRNCYLEIASMYNNIKIYA